MAARSMFKDNPKAVQVAIQTGAADPEFLAFLGTVQRTDVIRIYCISILVHNKTEIISP